MSRKERLVTPAWVEELFKRADPTTFVVLEVAWCGEPTPHERKFMMEEEKAEPEEESDAKIREKDAAYSSARGDISSPKYLPHAITVHPSYVEAGLDSTKYYPKYTCPEDGNLLPDAQLHRHLADLGITEDTLVVVYGKGSVIPMTSCRVLWALMYAGVKDFYLLDGGFDAWLRHGGRVVSTPQAPVSASCFSTTGACVREYLATTEEVARIASNPSASKDILVDIRKLGEVDGTFAENYEFYRESGHIPTAVHQGNWDILVDVQKSTLREVQEIKLMWQELGILSADCNPTLIFYCGTGWRSSIGFFIGYLMGLSVKNYDDGFYGWIAAGNIIHTGAPPLLAQGTASM